MYVLKTKEMKVPLKVFSEKNSIEEQCIEQMEKVCSLPFIHHHTALMADGHFGRGASIGSVVATKGVVIPHLIGSDISCGLCAVKTSLKEIDTDTLKKIMGEVRKVIPIGLGKHHQEAQDESLMPKFNPAVNPLKYKIINREYNSALKQLGTLGAHGNHFIEIQKGNDNHIYIMIHSGSRNLGLQVANHYNKLAVELNEKWHSSVPKKWELAFLPLDSEEGQAYLREMNYCVEFAFANRKLMMDRVMEVFTKEFHGWDLGVNDKLPGIEFGEMININHNFAQLENHFNSNVMVHRKGATLATKNTIGIIPGSMGSPSYITKGKGNPDSFNSSPHGAGRIMSRTRAKEELSLENEMKILNDQGIVHGIRNRDNLDEAVGSYKDISQVMKNSEDLVEILVELRPLASIKG